MGGLGISLLAVILAWLLIGLGLISIFFPFVPSIPMIWFGIFIYVFSHNFNDAGQWFMTIISMVAIFTIFLDYTLNKFGVHKIRVGAWAVVGAILGVVLGSFAGPWVAYLIGPLLGAIIFELMSGRDQAYSYQAGNTTIVAFMGGTVVKFSAAIVMIGLFVLHLQGKV